jgi:hypothetical protein
MRLLNPAWLAGTLLLCLAQSAQASAWHSCLSLKDADRRFSCLLPHESSLNGDPAYEEQLALAARQSGHDSYASIVLERLLWRHPGHAGARLDLALTAVKMGNLTLARQQLQHLQQQSDIPVHAQHLMQQLEQAIQGRTTHKDQLALTLLAGQDSNANLGIQDHTLALSLNGEQLTLATADTLHPKSSPWLETRLNWSRTLNSQTHMQLYARRQYFTQAPDENSLQLAAGISRSLSLEQQLSINAHYLDLSDGSWLSGLNTRLQQRLGCQNCVLSLGAELNDSSQASIGPLTLYAGVAHSYRSAYLGQEAEALISWQQQSDAPWGSTLNLGLSAKWFRQTEARQDYLRLGIRAGHDDAPYSPLFGDARRDTRLYSLELGSEYRLTPHWRLAGSLRLSRQTSDIPLYQYRRRQASLALIWTPE